MSSSDDEPDDMPFSLEGKSIYTAKPRGDQQKKLEPESGKPSNAITEPEISKPRIRRVPDELRKNKKLEKYFEPRAVSIGPLHHGNIKFSQTDRHKLELEKLFREENGLDEDQLHKKIKTQIYTLKRCYVEDDIKRVNVNDDDLAWMFLGDGCALLHYICYAAIGKLNNLKIGLDMEAVFQHDLFLLANQLPYQVLDIIMRDTADGGANMKNLINEFIDKTARDIRGPSFGETASPTAPQQPAPAHLLELLRKRLVGDCEKEKADSGQNRKEKMKTEKQQVRKVNELKAAGIQFKSETRGSLRDISFVSHRFTGTLTLPSLVVDDSTATKLWNLIAFEMCPYFENDFLVSSYISFLHSLINQTNDVEELRKAQVLHNALGSDEDVTRFFKEIGTYLDSIPEAYLEVKDSIQKHCQKKWNTWINLLCSPWTFFAVVAAVAVLIMSFSSRVGAP